METHGRPGQPVLARQDERLTKIVAMRSGSGARESMTHDFECIAIRVSLIRYIREASEVFP